MSGVGPQEAILDVRRQVIVSQHHISQCIQQQRLSPHADANLRLIYSFNLQQRKIAALLLQEAQTLFHCYVGNTS